MSFQHKILVLFDHHVEADTLSLLQENFSLHLLSSGHIVSPLALYVASPQGGKARVRTFF